MEVIPHGDLLLRLPAEEFESAAHLLSHAIKYGWQVRGWPIPPLLLEWRRLIASAQFRAEGQVSGGVGTGDFRGDPPLSGLEQPARLTTREAATLAGVSERWVRALARNEDVQASRVSGGAWAIDISSLSAWIRQRREDHEKAA